MDIDYVVPMVFDDDEQWRKDYVTAHHVLRYGGGNVRYRSWGNEELLIRCIRKFMPFVRTIYIILARESQKKAWMDGEPFGEARGTVRVVYHREFVPEKYLPCFNSCTLEMFVPFIEGLSEYFIYGNDDMFPVSPLKETDFFVNGLPVQHLSEKAFSDKPGIFQRKCKRQQEMVAGAIGKRLGGRWLKNGHGLAPMLKSACLEARERFDKEVTSGITLYRSETSYNQYLYVLWQYFTGRCVDGRVESTYLSVKDTVERVRDVLSKAKGVVCMNDHEQAGDVTEYASVFRSEIERRLSMRVALVAIGRLENDYAREFVGHHLSVGFDKVVIYDNNRRGEEHFEDVLQDYITRGQVEVVDYRDREAAQRGAYNDAYQRLSSEYDWIAFFDFDEFLCFADGEASGTGGDAEKPRCTVKGFLEGITQEFEAVMVPWVVMTDNGHVRKDERPLVERFTESVEQARVPGKCIVRGGIKDLRFVRSVHVPSNPVLRCCSPSGEPVRQHREQKADTSVCYLRHFCTKTIEEWVMNKWKKGAAGVTYEKFKEQYKDYFFRINKRTPEKEAYIKAYEQNRSRQLVVCIVHYNTPELTLAAIRSLWKHSPGVYVIVFDNSDSKPFHYRMANVEVIDNTKGQHINFDQWLSTFPDKQPINNGYASAKHCYSVQWLIAHRRRPFLLMDSDVLIKKDIVTLFNSGYAYVGEEKMHKSRFGNVMRVLPFLCYIDVPMVKQNVVSFYHPKKMFALSSVSPDNAYDTGCWFYEDCHQHHLPVCSISISDYAVHFGHGSWKDKDASEWLEAHETLWK